MDVKVGVFGRADALTFSSNGSRLNSSTWSAVREFLAFSEFCFFVMENVNPDLDQMHVFD